jgi:predicted 3-demethylubiquinone-9 3-methyltransferase (glyoxalase superfamily)
MQKITPFLWFNGDAEEAVAHYTSIFKDSKVHGGASAGGVIPFQLAGQQFLALNGGPQFKFSEALSLVVSVETQAELDEASAKLASGGELGHCGWLKDKYGLSWQVVPTCLATMMQEATPEQAGRVMQAMMSMQTIDIARLRQAYAGEAA